MIDIRITVNHMYTVTQHMPVPVSANMTPSRSEYIFISEFVILISVSQLPTF